MRFMTEVTPAVFSRNDSLSSLEYEVEDRRRDEVQLGAGLTHFCQKKYKYNYNLAIIPLNSHVFCASFAD